MTKPIRTKGKISLRKMLQSFNEGDKVILKAEPGIQNGIYFRRFHGSIGTVVKKLNTCYEVAIKDQNKAKKVIVHPVHLTKTN